MIADWIYEWGPPKGGTIFSGFDGMGTVVMAAMSLETFNVFAFEKDERIWRAAIDEVTNFASNMDNKMAKFIKQIKASTKEQHLVHRAMTNPASITEDEVLYLYFTSCLVRKKHQPISAMMLNRIPNQE